MITKEEYLKNPCRMLSIPYWKYKNIKLPENIIPIHIDDYKNNIKYKNKDIFKRLSHNLLNINSTREDRFILKEVDIEKDIPIVINIINKSYENISVNHEQIISYTKTKVYNSSLWIIIYLEDKPVGLGIADYDGELKEGILEWIQVLPEYRNISIGSFIVNELLKKIKSLGGEFTTVSFDKKNPSNPEKLYRKSGFTGEDIYYILHL